MNTRGLLVWAGCLGALASCSSPGLSNIDPSVPAIQAGDFTALISIEGCGFQPQVQEGYTYCRIPEGPAGTLAVTFLAPPQAKHCAPHACPSQAGQTGQLTSASCQPTACVDFTLFYPDQSPAYQDSIPPGQASKTVPWTTLTKKADFTPDDTGFWIYTYTIRWTGADGFEHKTVSDGEIRLRVIRTQTCDAEGANCAAYVPLRSAADDPAFVWSWVESGQAIRMTTAGRTYVSYADPQTPPSPQPAQARLDASVTQ